MTIPDTDDQVKVCGAQLQAHDFEDGFPQYECTRFAGHRSWHAYERGSWTDGEHWIDHEIEDAIVALAVVREREQSLALLTALRAIANCKVLSADFARVMTDIASETVASYEAAHVQVAHEEALDE